jgi:Uma2 family endonuclease
MAERAVRPATYADLEAVPDHLVAEIIDGVLETHPRPRPRHQRAAGRLNTRLSTPFEDGEGGPGGWIFIIEPELHLESDVVVPDIAGWRADRLSSEPPEPFIAIPPDWVCEVLSPATARLDRGAKRRIYAAAGVNHLWLLDPTAGELEAFGLKERQWVLLSTIQRGGTVAVPPFEAAPFPLDDLFPFDTPSSTEA